MLDAIDAIYDVAFDAEDVNPVLEPFVTELVHLLARLEVRVKGARKGDVLSANDDGSPSQMRLWFRVTEILQRWTGQVHFTWFEDWLNFWSLAFSEKRANKKPFDFWGAREGAVGQVGGQSGKAVSGTRVVLKKEDFFGIEAKTSKFLIILDVSGSMDENPQAIDRLTILKEETLRFLRSLKPGTHFNLLPFSSKCDIKQSLTGSHELRAKTVPRGRIDKATRAWVVSLKSGGTTRVDLAFRAAYLKPIKFDPLRPYTGVRKFKPRFAEIYFITDGSPTAHKGRLLNRDEQLDLLKEIRGLNARHRFPIHTIGYHGMHPGFIQSLAHQNGGTYKMLLPKR